MNESNLESGNASGLTGDAIDLRGVCTNNLKNIDVRFPHGSISVVTGPSGCGKSSLVLDTVYSEAKRQFLDSLPFHARQSLQYLPRPDLRSVQGLLPVVCIGQQTSTPNSRSTVGTTTGIHDFLRLLMTRIGTVKCSSCGRTIDQHSTDQIEQSILSLPERTRLMILAPVATFNEPQENQHGKDSTNSSTLEEKIAEIRKSGFVRVRINGEIVDVESVDCSANDQNQQVEAVVDRIIAKPGIEDRVAESVAHALKIGDGNLNVLCQQPDKDEWTDKRFSTLYACPDCHESYQEIETRTFSYFSPFGVCTLCEGTGTVEQFSIEKVFDPPTSQLSELDVFQKLPEEARNERLQELVPILQSHGLSLESRVDSIDADTLKTLFAGDQINIGFRTVLEKVHVTAVDPKLAEHVRTFRQHHQCPECLGTRLCTAANHVFITGCNLGQIVQKQVTEAIEFFDDLPSSLDSEQNAIAEPILSEILDRLKFMSEVGLGYLHLDRRADSLSGGEFQRVRLATGLGNRLSDVCYVLDEPTSGLHPSDNERLLRTVRDVRQLGNTVVIVEHDSAAMATADFLVDLGPGAGDQGGHIQAMGTYSQLLESEDSNTAKYLRNEYKITKQETRTLPPDDQWVSIDGAELHNLSNVTFRFPTARITAVTGVSGSGKSSMVSGILVPAIQSHLMNRESPQNFRSLTNANLIQRVVEVDQSPIGRSPRSNAATFTGMFDEIRKLFAKTKLAKQKGLNASQFSFNNRAGACPHCNGQGVISVEMRFMPDVVTECEICHGKRFRHSILEIQFKEKNIAEILDLSINEAYSLFENIEKIRAVLEALKKTGLGYLKLGQPATSLSGGESQRLKIANYLAQSTSQSTLYVLDEPTSGLHFSDIDRLHSVIQELVDQGHTIILVEHNMDLVKNADYVIDFGPDGGLEGGQIVAQGTPEEVSNSSQSHTARYLSPLVNLA